MGVHTNYKPGEILWFLRNYWKYDRNGLIEEYQRHFQDANFGRSQYTWLRARYGMKEEWGAVLNHPPYSGAIPGGTNTQYYEAGSVPNAAPRPNFKQTSESGSPPTQSAQELAPPQSSFQFTATPNMQTLLLPFSPHTNDAASRNGVQPAMGYMDPSTGLTMEQSMGTAMGPNMATNMAPNMAYYGGQGSVPGMHTSMNTGMDAGLQSLPGAAQGTAGHVPSPNTGHVNGSHHTYAFPMSGNMIPYSAVSTSMTGGNQAMGMNMGMDMNVNNMNVNAQALAYNMEPWGLGIETSYPQQHLQQQQPFSMPSNTQGYIPATAPGHMSFADPASMPFFTANTLPAVPEMYPTGALTTTETAALPNTGHSSSSKTDNSKRKRSEFDIELREPQKRQMLAMNSADMSLSGGSGPGLGAGLVAAALPTTQQNIQENQARKTATGRRKKKAKQSRSMSIPELGASPTPHAELFTAATSSPAGSSMGSSPTSQSASQTTSHAASPSSPPVTTIDPRGEWFDGTHPSCPISLRHRHDNSGGIYVVTGSPKVQSSVESTPKQQQKATMAAMSQVCPVMGQAIATESPSYEYAPTPVVAAAPTPADAVNDASFLYATPLSTTGTSVADVNNPATAADEVASAASPAVTSLFGSPVSPPDLDPVVRVLTPSVSAPEPNAQSFDQSAVPALTSATFSADLTQLPELDGVWDMTLNTITDTDVDNFWSTGVVSLPTNVNVFPISADSGAASQQYSQHAGSATGISAGLPSPAPTALITPELDSSLLQFDSNTFGMADAEINALLSEIEA